MSNQIFRRKIPLNILYDLLDSICIKTDKYYKIDNNVFRILKYYNYYSTFAETICEYYHSSKQFYVTRPLTYNSFTNIIRQICKSYEIKTVSLQKYNESEYTIELYIYYSAEPNLPSSNIIS